MTTSRREETRVATRAHARTARFERVAAAALVRRLERNRRAVILTIWAALSTVGVIVTAFLRGVFDPVELVFFASLVGTVVFALFSGVLAKPPWLMERQLQAGADVALAVAHLPPTLAELARTTRALRLAVEAAAPDDVEVTRWVWAWISSVRELGPREAAILEQLGLSHRDVEGVLLGDALGPGAGDEEALARAARRGRPPPARLASETPEAKIRRLELLAEHFEAFEVALLGYNPDPYRGG